MEILEMETEKDFKDLGSGESKPSQSQRLFGQMVGEASGVSSFGENCRGSVLVAEENGVGNGGGIDVHRENTEVIGLEMNGMFASGENGFGLQGVENSVEPLVVAGGSLSARDVEKEIKRQTNSVNNGGGLLVDEDLEVEGNEGIGVEKVVTNEDVENGNDAMQLCEVDSSKKTEISGDGISLYVEFFGPLDVINQADKRAFSDKHVLTEGNSNVETFCKTNGTLSSCDGEDTSAKISETDDFMLDVVKNNCMGEEVNGQNKILNDDFGTKECNFVVGDLVWAKTKTQLWWPGLITDPSSTTKGNGDSNNRDPFLVKYYGNANLIWCSSSQLKHFLEYFFQMSQQNNSRSFHGAVERAVSEIGRRVKLDMTCSCISRESQTFSAQSADQYMGRYSLSKDKMGEFSAFLESQHEPASFLQSVKHLALGVSLPGMIKLIVTQNCLSAFFRSLGHCQLPMHQLKPTNAKDDAHSGLILGEKDAGRKRLSRANCCDDEFDKKLSSSSTRASKIKEEKKSFTAEVEVFADCELASSKLMQGENDMSIDIRSGKGHESRERKKSKYLSYPYIDPKKGHEDAPSSAENETEDLKKVPQLGMKMNSNSSQADGDKKSLKPGSRKSSSSVDMFGKVKDIDSSSTEILSELHLTALDCLYSKGRQYSGSVNRFLCGFRRCAFLNFEISNEHIGDSNEERSKFSVCGSEGRNGEDAVEHPSSSGKPKKRRRKKADEHIGDSNEERSKSSVCGSEGRNGEDAVEHPSSSGKPKKRWKRKADGTSVGSMCSDLNTNAIHGSVVIQCEDVGSGMQKSEIVCKKRENKTGTDLGISEIKPATGLPDLNGNIPTSSVEDKQVTEASAFHCEPKIRQTPEFAVQSSHTNASGLLDPSRYNIKFVQLLKDVQAMGPNFLNSIPQQSNMQGETASISEIMARQSEANGGFIQFGSPLKNLQSTPLLTPGAKSLRRKRKRKEKATNVLDPKVTSSIPDLNGNVAESVSPGNNTPDINSASPQGKPPRKRRRRKSTSAAPDVHANLTKVKDNLGVSAAPFTPFTQPLLPVDGLKTPAMPSGSKPQNSDPPDLLFIKKNLEMMTSTLEKAGDSLSPEMRIKLESEITSFMKKISSMVGSSSS
ncbi:hypothetical protein ACH5RR_025557 [Cinchona calisaya]|uniref:PWWP domain-containing protein n=1 Tax=Cinchona calisaya TaxID=153742 RepID=A0ABD2YZZ3_9GENT